MNKQSTFLSIVIPQYNERLNLEQNVLENVYNYLKKQEYTWEVLVSDDGSNDKSIEVAKERIKKLPNFRLIQGEHGGKATALYNGLKESKGEYVLFTDMDQSTPLKEIEKLLPYTDKYQVVIGSRGSKRDQTTAFRKLASFLFSHFRRSLLLKEIEDTQCGFKLFKSENLVKYFSMLDAIKKSNVKGWTVTAFDVELLFITQKKGLKIKEVMVDWKNADFSETKGKKFVKESIDMLKQILKVRTNNLKGKYNN